ncbi:MAG: aspartate aminotransferase family protein [bacterium]
MPRDNSETTDEPQILEHAHHAQLYRRYPITLIEGRGAKVRDAAGKEYVDALAGIAVNSVGHCHPEVVEAIRSQAGKLIHASNLYYFEPQSRLAKRLTRAAGLERVFFTNSGTEAVEGALKLARLHARKLERRGGFISMEGCFHGRSTGALSLHNAEQRRKFEPLLEGCRQIPFNDLDALAAAMDDTMAAVILEPIQGEGGVRPADLEYLRGVRRLCDRHGALMILDEIQTGIGRTGTFFAYQQADIVPDIVTSAKALGGGVPIGAVLARDEVAAAFAPGDHGTTYGGNPLACAAADAAVRVVLEENLAGRAVELGAHLMDLLRDGSAARPAIREIRGRGLMIGVELAFPGKSVVTAMLERGVLANCTAENVMRFVPPLVISREEIETIARVFFAALDACSEQAGKEEA